MNGKSGQSLSGYSILTIAPPFHRLPYAGAGAIEKIVLQRTAALASLGAKITVVAPLGSVVAGSDHLIETDPLSIKPTRQTGLKVTDAARTFLHSRWVDHGWTFLKISDMDYASYDCILNDSFRSDPWNMAVARRVFGCRTRIDILHGNPPFWTKLRSFARRATPVLGALNRHSCELLTRNGWRSAFIPNGIDVGSQKGLPHPPGNYLIFLGRICREKGVDQAIRIAKGVGLPLHILGPTQDTAYFEEFVRPFIDGETVIYYGEQSSQAVSDILSKASALVFTSQYDDPLPTVLLEATVLGIPIVATRPGWLSGFWDVCDDGNCVTGDSVENVIKRFDHVLELSREKILIDARGRFTWEDVISRYYMPLFKRIRTGADGS